MIYALVDGKPTRPTATGQRAACGCCGGAEMISVCGSQVAWHWRHAVGADCDSWAAGKETPWHHDWKMRIGEGDPARIERVMVRDGVTHRADAVATHPDGDIVVEVQHSGLSQVELTQREDFYGRMVWLMDESGFGRSWYLGREHFQVKRKFGRPVILDTVNASNQQVLILLKPSIAPGVMCGERLDGGEWRAAVDRATAPLAPCEWCKRYMAKLQEKAEAQRAIEEAIERRRQESVARAIAASEAASLARAQREAEDRKAAEARARRAAELQHWRSVRLRPGDQAAIEADLRRLDAEAERRGRLVLRHPPSCG